MTFKVGDKVRYTNTKEFPKLEGWEAEVVETHLTSKGTTRVKTLKNPGNAMGTYVGKTGCYYSRNLELIEQPYTFADIQVGDKIRRTLTRKNGSTHVSEGVVVSTDALSASDSEGYKLAYGSDGNPFKGTVVLELLDRPKPKHWTETKPIGSVGVILDGQFTKTITKVNEGEWRVYYSIDGFNYTDANPHVKARTADLDEAKLHWIK